MWAVQVVSVVQKMMEKIGLQPSWNPPDVSKKLDV